MPQDISVHGHLIDEQYSDTMAEAGLSFLPLSCSLLSSSGSFPTPSPRQIKTFPGGAKD